MSYNPNNPDSIRPQNYPYSHAFYFDGEMALMMGNYKDDPTPSIGMRWMVAEGPIGYPVSRSHPMWMVVPGQLALYMLEGIEVERSGGRAAHLLRPDIFEEALHEMRRQLGAGANRSQDTMQ